MVEKEVMIREAQAEDAKALADALRQVSIETEFLTRDDDGSYMSEEEARDFIEQRLYAKNQICLVAKVGDSVAGLLNVAASNHCRTEHIGDMFIAVQKVYWGHGLGQLLFEAALDWAIHSGVIRRLELTVQARNQRAIHIYQKYGFEIEGIRKRGAKTKNGEFLDVYAMYRLID